MEDRQKPDFSRNWPGNDDQREKELTGHTQADVGKKTPLTPEEQKEMDKLLDL